jgi:hypothetical protein
MIRTAPARPNEISTGRRHHGTRFRYLRISANLNPRSGADRNRRPDLGG